MRQAEKQQNQPPPVSVERDPRLPGVGGVLAAETVARARPDGYTLWIGGAGTLASAPWLFKKPTVDPKKDFVYLSPLLGQAFILSVDANTPYKTVADLTAAFAKYLAAETDESTPRELASIRVPPDMIGWLRAGKHGRAAAEQAGEPPGVLGRVVDAAEQHVLERQPPARGLPVAVGRGHHIEHPEPPRVDVAQQLCTAGPLQHHAPVLVGLPRRVVDRLHEQASAHAEVREQRVPVVEVEEQELARATRLPERTALERLGQGRERGGAQAVARHARARDAPSGHVAREHAADGLDLREFGHGAGGWRGARGASSASRGSARLA